jgi:hypothetical protein
MSAPAVNFLPLLRPLFASGAEGQLVGHRADGAVRLAYGGPDPFANDADAAVFAVAIAEHVRTARWLGPCDSLTLACAFSDEDGADDEDDGADE